LAAVLLSNAVAERLVPWMPPPAPSRDRGRDLAHAFVNESLTAGSVALVPLLAACSPWRGAWPAAWPLGLQWLLAVLAADVGITLMHAASHRVPWLWRLHAVHHSVERLHGLNGLLKHPLHQALETLAGVVPLVLLGLPPQVAELLACSVALQLVLQHSNVDMRLGPLRHLLALAPVHRFHHRDRAGIGDVNFGLFTTLVDRLLGTHVDDPHWHFAPDGFGIASAPDYPHAYLAQLAEPFAVRPAAGPA
jgi:sterol desaturase/sphingolipid hydroxylase (fatty acid hydroxylase superfamily)